ncbi:hypothetical protein [Endozoicomonas sp. Mp262]|uniref:hypothetical protein n=1 Tax=Endozoicomonas sp. Mp262 TaxID=2919499 RepID=UPI0021DB389D
MSIEGEVGNIYRPLNIQIDGLALAESIRQQIEAKRAEVETKAADVQAKHGQVQTWHANVAQWQQDTADYRDAANTYQQQAAVARNASETAAAAADVSKVAAEAAKNTAVSAKTDAESARDLAQTYRDSASSSATLADQSKDSANAAKVAAEAARDQASTHKTNAQTARDEANTAKAGADAAEAKAEKWAEEVEDVAVETGKYSAKHHAEKSADSAASALSYRNTAQTYRDEANTAKANAQTAESSANSHKNTASTKATEASNSANKAEQWADADDNVQVEAGRYSAKHYANLAQTYSQGVTSGLMFKGGYNASSNTAPPTPASDTPDYYRITGAGTINGIDYNVNDNICWDPILDQWFKIDNTDRAITDSLTSTSSDTSLSAKAGKQLQDTKFNKAGDTLSGAINFTPDSGSIITLDGKTLLRRHDQAGAVSFGADNGLVIGSGDSRAAVVADSAMTSEVLHLSSDNMARVLTNCQNGIGGAKTFNFNIDGSFSTDGEIRDVSGRCFSPGYMPSWNQVQSKPATFPPSSHNHDADYIRQDATDINAQTFDGRDSTQFAWKESSVAAATGGDWVTIALVDGGGRASGRFKVGEAAGGNHGHVEFYAGVSFGNVPVINILSAGGYGSFTGLLKKLRIIKDSNDEIYGVHKLQLLLETTTTLYSYLYEDEQPHNRWKLTNYSETGTPTGYTEAVSIDLDKTGGISTTGEFYAQGGYKVYHENNPPPAGAGGGAGGRKNLLINGDFKINQRSFDGNWAALANGTYGFDRWKKHANGIEQIVEAGWFPAGTYYLSWQGGTGDGQVDGVTVAKNSSVEITDPSQNISIVVPADATLVQFERGAVSEFEYMHITSELALCYRYYQMPCKYAFLDGYSSSTDYLLFFVGSISMRVNPTMITLIPGSQHNISSLVSVSHQFDNRPTIRFRLISTGNAYWINFTAAFDAEL